MEFEIFHRYNSVLIQHDARMGEGLIVRFSDPWPTSAWLTILRLEGNQAIFGFLGTLLVFKSVLICVNPVEIIKIFLTGLTQINWIKQLIKTSACAISGTFVTKR
jgi:hypothetical protein